MWFTFNKSDNRIVGTTDDTEKAIYNDKDWFLERYYFKDVDEYLSELSYEDEDDKILKVMNAAKLYNEMWKYEDMYCIQIEWGDWKHDHLFCDSLMKALGYELALENVTAEDGSDCYSSIHNYRKCE